MICEQYVGVFADETRGNMFFVSFHIFILMLQHTVECVYFEYTSKNIFVYGFIRKTWKTYGKYMFDLKVNFTIFCHLSLY